MLHPPVPPDEGRRVAALREYEILDTLAERSFDAIVKLASEICGVPISLVTLVDSTRQWFKAKIGLSIGETPRDVAFCAHAIARPGELFVVRDALTDERFRDNPLVTGDPQIRFYAGVPLVTGAGLSVGSLCVIDTVPRALSDRQLSALRLLGEQVVNLLDLRKTTRRLEREQRQRTAAERDVRLLETAVEHARDGIAIFGPPAIRAQPPSVRYINAAFAALTDCSPDTAPDAVARLFCPAAGNDEVAARLRRAFVAREPVIAQTTLTGRNGTETCVEASLSPIGSDDVAGPYWICIVRDVTDRKRAEAESLRAEAVAAAHAATVKSEERLRSLFAQVPAIVWTTDRSLNVISSHGAALSQRFRDARAPVPLASVLPAEGAEKVLDAHRKALAGERATYHMEFDGGSYHSYLDPLRDEEGTIVGVRGVGLNVTEFYAVRGALRRSRQNLKRAQRIAGLGSWEYDFRTGQRSCSDHVFALFGLPVGETPDREMLHRRVHPDDRRSLRAAYSQACNGRSYAIDFRVLHETGTRWLREHVEARTDERGAVLRLIGTVLDVTERKMSEERLVRLAHFDPLTGLPNRALLGDRLHAALASDASSPVALLFIDVDRFKTVNDTLGHGAGDRLLQRIAHRLSAVTRSDDVVARVGGDEFVVLVCGKRPDDNAVLAARIIDAFTEPFTVDGRELFCTVSIGIATTAAQTVPADELFRSADTAMYVAKAEGRNTLRFFENAMHVGARERLALETDLRRALEREQLFLEYQPIVDARGIPVALEALVRWRHPARGVIAPDAFIPVAEDTGIIVDIGRWVMRRACRDLARLRSRRSSLRLAVNVSARQFEDPRLVETVKVALAADALPADALELEITESAIMRDLSTAVGALTRLRAAGVRISVDDFGTGYSSLGSLKHLPIDTLKIDRSLIAGVPGNAGDSAIAHAVVSLGRALGVAVLAEGVETPEQAAFLSDAGCAMLQGFYFARPQSIDDAEQFLSPALVPERG